MNLENLGLLLSWTGIAALNDRVCLSSMGSLNIVAQVASLSALLLL